MQSASGREVGRIAAAVVLVSVGMAAGLRLADAVPSIVLGEPRGISRHPSLREAAASLGAPLLVPAYLPGQLRARPTSIRTGRVPEAGAAIHYGGADGRERLFVFETLPGGTSFPDALVPEARPFHSVPVSLGAGPGVFRSVRAGPDGELAEVEFRADGRRVLLRFAGTGDELMKIAGSLREER